MESLLATLEKQGAILVKENLSNLSKTNEKAGFTIVFYETNTLMRSYIRKYLPRESMESFIEQIKSPDVKGLMGFIASGETTRKAYKQSLNIFRPQLQKIYSIKIK